MPERGLSASDLRREAARAKDPRAARRMLALAQVLEGKSRAEAAENCGMDRQTLRDRVHRYNAEGLVGLGNRPLQGRRPRLSGEQMQEPAMIVETGPDPVADGVVRWCRIDLCAVVERRFRVRHCPSPTWWRKSLIGDGRTPLRDALCMPALFAMRFNCDLKAKHTALRDAGKPAKVAIIAIMRKLIETVNALVKADRL